MKVTSVRYFETNKGVGYQCKTNIKDVFKYAMMEMVEQLM
jgi:hypothetical protein